jgi:RsiW-degrading membrane proteinase PrsW (M82 family)
MTPWLAALVALAPVVCFLSALLWLDGYKLLRPAVVALAMLAGAVLALVCYELSDVFLDGFGLTRSQYSLWAAPVLEEALKAAAIVALIRASRIGFFVDGTIYGFAVGSGFALLENLHYLQIAPDSGIATWVIRGFGTAIMHGGSTALFTVTMLAMLTRWKNRTLAAAVAGLAPAVVLHGAFNHLAHVPHVATLVIVVLVPAALLAAFHLGERALSRWLGSAFDSDALMLELIQSGEFASSPPGVYLQNLRRNLDGMLVADMLCYLRIYTELALRAKAVLMMHESGFATTGLDEQTRARFEELQHLERIIGPAGIRALHPLMRARRQDLWQLYVLKTSA